jgi:hypothetical protein
MSTPTHQETYLDVEALHIEYKTRFLYMNEEEIKKNIEDWFEDLIVSNKIDWLEIIEKDTDTDIESLHNRHTHYVMMKAVYAQCNGDIVKFKKRCYELGNIESEEKSTIVNVPNDNDDDDACAVVIVKQ